MLPRLKAFEFCDQPWWVEAILGLLKLRQPVSCVSLFYIFCPKGRARASTPPKGIKKILKINELY